MEVMDYKRKQKELEPTPIKKFLKQNSFLIIYWFFLLLRLVFIKNEVIATSLLMVMMVIAVILLIQLTRRMKEMNRLWEEEKARN